MVDVDAMSDAELRTKLIEFGFPVMPITGTTRKLMVKKLKMLMDNKNKSSTDGRRSLGRYSSEEDSDTDVKITKKDKGRRTTMAAPVSQVTSRASGITLRKSNRFNDSDHLEQPPPVAKDTVVTKRTTTTKIIKSVQDEFDTGSDSEPEIMDNNFDLSSSIGSNHSYKRDSFSPSSMLNFQPSSSKYAPPTNVTSSSYISGSYSSVGADKPVLSTRFTSFNSPSANSDAALDRLNQIRSRLSLGNTAYERPSCSTPMDTTEDKVETPFLSNFTRRLSQLSSANSPKLDYDYKNDIIKEHDTNGAGNFNRNYVGRSMRYRDVNRDYYPRQSTKMGNNIIPFTLVGVACLFFVVVAVMYYGMRSNDHSLEATDYFIPRCVASDADSKPGVNCVIDSEIDNAVKIMRAVKPELTRRAIGFVCNEPSVKPYMEEADVMDFHQRAMRDKVSNVERHLQNMEILTFKNPEWGISVVKADDTSGLSEEDAFKNMGEALHYKANNLIGLAVLNPPIPLRCSLYNKFYAILNAVVVLFGTFFLLYLCNLLYKYFKRYQKQQKDEVFNMVERIVEILQNTSAEDGDSFLIINHVRDMIIPITDRKRLEKTWEKVVKFIKDNESRIRTEVQVVQGEHYEVWRWLGSPNLNTSASPRSKTWQGQAFETQVGSVNSLPCSPTPCLKIRGMVDENESNINAIREAVLSKCAHQCRILHCGVDTTSKCVYLKCADQNDAAIAYRNLHGWWYAGHLVTVKYLRLERYMQRFPDSPASGPPYLKSLAPSNAWSS